MSELAQALAPRIGRLVVTLRRETAAAGLTRAQLSVLAALRDGPRRITELAELEQVSQPTMTALVSRLERRAWVTRRTDRTDRRGVNVALAAAGRRMLDRVSAARASVLAERLSRLPSADRAAIGRAIPAIDRLLETPMRGVL